MKFLLFKIVSVLFSHIVRLPIELWDRYNSHLCFKGPVQEEALQDQGKARDTLGITTGK